MPTVFSFIIAYCFFSAGKSNTFDPHFLTFLKPLDEGTAPPIPGVFLFMSVIRTQRKERFTSICNELLSDTTISFKAKGLLCYLISRPPNWNANVNHLSNNFKEGKDAIYAILNELIVAGYVVRIRMTDGNGRYSSVEYHVYESPQREIPCVEIPHVENPDNNNNGLLINTDSNNGPDNPATNPVEKKEDKKVTLQSRKIDFLKLIIDWIVENPNKYPKLMYLDFAKYWTECTISNKKQKFRFEDQRYFDVGRRLGTWSKNTKQEDLQRYWEKEKETRTVNDLFKTEILHLHEKPASKE